MNKLKKLFEIYITFFKLGSVSFGGGYAVVSLMEREAVDERQWVEKDDIVDIFSVAQSLPGAIALNSSAFIGYTVAGIPGAIFALLGNLTPPVFIMLSLSVLFTQFSENVIVQNVLYGIKPVVVGLILYAGYKIGKTAITDKFTILIAIIAFCLALFLRLSVIYIIIGGILVGLLLSIIKYLKNTNNFSSQMKDGE